MTGAGRRIGRSVALRLAAEGARVVVHYRHSDAEAREVVEQIVAAGGDALCLAADLARVEEIERLFADIERHCGGLEILVNNAATFAPRRSAAPPRSMGHGDRFESQVDILLLAERQLRCSNAATEAAS